MNATTLTQEQWVVSGIGWALELVAIFLASLALWSQKRAAKKARKRRRAVLREVTVEYYEEKLQAEEGLRYHGTGMRVKVRQEWRDL